MAATESTCHPAVSEFVTSKPEINSLLRGKDGNLYLYRKDRNQTNLIWKTDARFRMDQVAFSPSAERMAFANEKEKYIEIIDVRTGQDVHGLLPAIDSSFDNTSLVWLKEESKFCVNANHKYFVANIQPKRLLMVEMSNNTNASDWNLTIESVSDTNSLEILPCYGRICNGGCWGGGDDWGALFNEDKWDRLSAWSEPGLGSGLNIYRENHNRSRVLTVAVNPGLMHLATFNFGDVAFLKGGDECLFQANDYIYLVDIGGKRVGTVTRGERFILLTPRYQKHL